MPTTIKVMTYNIQLGAGSNSMARYIYDWISVSLARPHSSKNIETIIENIKTISPDILTITESEYPSARNEFANYNQMIQNEVFLRRNILCRYAGFQCHYAITKSGLAKKNQSNAIFIKSDHDFMKIADSYLNFEKSEQRRCIGRSDIYINTGAGRLPVSVFVTHLSVSKKYRPKQIEEVLAFTEHVDGLVILTGDFNIKKDESELNPIKEKYKDTGPLRTWPSWGNPKYPMDRIFVSKEFDIVNSFAPKVRGSDHLPLVAVLRY